MKIPPGHTEASVVAAVTKAANILAPSFVFGPYDLDDIKQQCFLFALKVLDKGAFDPGRPLENYLYTGIRNELINFKRNKFRRNDPPCPRCHASDHCPDSSPGDVCPKYRSWLDRNQAKANLCNPLALDSVCDEKERRTRAASTAEADAEIGELLHLIDAKLPIELRQTYLQMRAGVSVPKGRRLQVERVVSEILRGAIECPSETD